MVHFESLMWIFGTRRFDLLHHECVCFRRLRVCPKRADAISYCIPVSVSYDFIRSAYMNSLSWVRDQAHTGELPVSEWVFTSKIDCLFLTIFAWMSMCVCGWMHSLDLQALHMVNMVVQHEVSSDIFSVVQFSLVCSYEKVFSGKFDGHLVVLCICVYLHACACDTLSTSGMSPYERVWLRSIEHTHAHMHCTVECLLSSFSLFIALSPCWIRFCSTHTPCSMFNVHCTAVLIMQTSD